MRFWLRWIANGIAVFLALFLVDSLLHERFRFEATWPAVVAAIVLGLPNSLVRPLHRVRSNPFRAVVVVLLTILVNALIVQLFVWVGADLTTLGFVWVLIAAAFVTLVSGLINWQTGFAQKGRPRAARERPGAAGRNDSRRPGRGDDPRPVRTERRRLSTPGKD